LPRWPSLHLRLPPRTPGCTGSRHAPLRKPHGDTRVGALERGYRVAAGPRRVPCRGRRLVESRSLSLTGPCRDVRCIAASFLKCRGWPSRQAPLAGALSLPGKILLPGPCLFILNALFLNGSKGTHGGLWRSSGKPCRAALQLPVHKFGILGYPYSSTPTGAPGLGPHTVPSAVGPGPKQGTGTRGAWVMPNLTPYPPRPP